MTPTRGRIVHFHPGGNDHPLVGLVVATHAENRVDLVVFEADRTVTESAPKPSGATWCAAFMTGVANVPYSENGQPGTWSWPPRVGT